MTRVSGPWRLLLLVAVATCLWLTTSALAHFALGEFPSFGEATWSGLRHLFDPGALADDDTAGERATGLVQLLIGLVFIVGLLVTVVQDTLAGSLRRLSEGDPKIRALGHLVIVGWDPLVPEIVQSLGGGAGQAVTAVIVPAALRGRRPEIEEDLNRRVERVRVRVIAGDPGPGSFERAGLRRASAVVIASGAESADGDSDAADMSAIASSLAVANHLGGAERPAVIPLLRRGENADSVSKRLPRSWRYVVADRAAAGIAGAACAHPELSGVLADGFANGYDTGLLRPLDPRAEDVGREFRELAGRLPNALPVGLVRGDGSIEPAPPSGERVGSEDRILVAPLASDQGDEPLAPAPVPVSLRAPATGARRLLCIAPRAMLIELVEDLASRSPGLFEVSAMATEPPGDLAPRRGNVALGWHRGDPDRVADLASAIESVDPEAIVISADLGSRGASADAGALLTAFRVAALGIAAETPILVDTLGDVDPSLIDDDPRIKVFSRGTVIASWIALLLRDPIAADATGALFEGRTVALEVSAVELHGAQRASFADVYEGLLARSAAPVGVIEADGSASMRPALDRPVVDGQKLILVRRRP